MGLQSGKCPKCGGCMLLESSHNHINCMYCGKEIIIPLAIQKCKYTELNEFDTTLIEAHRAYLDDNYQLSLQKYYDALLISPNDFRALWGAYQCEMDSLCDQINYSGYINFPGDGPKKLDDTINRLGQRAYEYAPNDIKIYYNKLLQDEYQRINAYRANPTIPQIKGCFIATEIYGTYDSPNLWVLRRYRDTVLLKKGLGKIFIKLYYIVNPIFIWLIKRSKTFKKLVKKYLDRKVQKLLILGISNQPYTDI